MIPHFIDKDPVLDVAFEDGCLVVLVGRAAVCRHTSDGPVYAVFDHYRLVYHGDGVVEKETLDRGRALFRTGSYEAKLARAESGTHPINDSRWQWARSEVIDSPPWVYERAPVRVDRIEFKKWVSHAKRFVGKATDERCLVALDLRPARVDVWTLGECSAFASFSVRGDEPARDGLGRVVVSMGSLAAAVREEDGSSLEIAYDPHSQRLQLGKSSLWLARVEPPPCPRLGEEPFECGALLSAALPFVSEDETREHYRSIQCHEALGALRVTASDGHLLYTQEVPSPPLCRVDKWEVPGKVAREVLRAGKGRALLSFDEDRLIVSASGLRVSCPLQAPRLDMVSILDKGEGERKGYAAAYLRSLVDVMDGTIELEGRHFKAHLFDRALEPFAALKGLLAVTYPTDKDAPIKLSVGDRAVLIAPCRV